MLGASFPFGTGAVVLQQLTHQLSRDGLAGCGLHLDAYRSIPSPHWASRMKRVEPFRLHPLEIVQIPSRRRIRNLKTTIDGHVVRARTALLRCYYFRKPLHM